MGSEGEGAELAVDWAKLEAEDKVCVCVCVKGKCVRGVPETSWVSAWGPLAWL